MLVFVLVGGWPASGKSTLARSLAAELGLAYIAKDEVKEALMDCLGAPSTVEESRELGAAAVAAVLRVARSCPGAVIDSTWFPYALPMVRDLPGPCVEIRCAIDVDVARERFGQRVRDHRHLDHLRDESELWSAEVPPLDVGPLIEVDTSEPVNVADLADVIRAEIEDQKQSSS